MKLFPASCIHLLVTLQFAWASQPAGGFRGSWDYDTRWADILSCLDKAASAKGLDDQLSAQLENHVWSLRMAPESPKLLGRMLKDLEALKRRDSRDFLHYIVAAFKNSLLTLCEEVAIRMILGGDDMELLELAQIGTAIPPQPVESKPPPSRSRLAQSTGGMTANQTLGRKLLQYLENSSKGDSDGPLEIAGREGSLGKRGRNERENPPEAKTLLPPHSCVTAPREDNSDPVGLEKEAEDNHGKERRREEEGRGEKEKRKENDNANEEEDDDEYSYIPGVEGKKRLSETPTASSPPVELDFPIFPTGRIIADSEEELAITRMLQDRIAGLEGDANIRLPPLPGQKERSISCSSLRRVLGQNTSLLDDAFINEYIQMLVARSPEHYRAISSLDKTLELVESFETGVFYIWPLHNDNHWSLLTIAVLPSPANRVEVYHHDSKEPAHLNYAKGLYELIQKRLDKGLWVDFEKGPSTQQVNTVDCGVFTCLNARNIMLSDSDSKGPIDAEDLYCTSGATHRTRLAIELVSGTLFAPPPRSLLESSSRCSQRVVIDLTG